VFRPQFGMRFDELVHCFGNRSALVSH
jgi:hypothetical protein